MRYFTSDGARERKSKGQSRASFCILANNGVKFESVHKEGHGTFAVPIARSAQPVALSLLTRKADSYINLYRKYSRAV